jgi:hypothetical protein
MYIFTISSPPPPPALGFEKSQVVGEESDPDGGKEEGRKREKEEKRISLKFMVIGISKGGNVDLSLATSQRVSVFRYPFFLPTAPGYRGRK